MAATSQMHLNFAFSEATVNRVSNLGDRKMGVKKFHRSFT
jgi:hypothetical protein